MTEMQVIAIYCFCDDFLKARGHQDWPNVKMTLAEVMLVYIVATRFFYGNIERAYKTLKDGRYISKGLSKGQLNIRLHVIENEIQKVLALKDAISSFVMRWNISQLSII